MTKVPRHFMTREGIKEVNEAARKQLERLRQQREERKKIEEAKKHWGADVFLPKGKSQ